jgi:putative addiction module component (TIGR02574 family)
MSSLTDQLLALSVEERLQIVEVLCESLADNAEFLSIPDWLEAGLARRKVAHETDPNSAIPWEEARDQLRQRYG